ncbi:MAG: hypothetical protein ACLP3K_11555 [Candidatus Acidiferrales bacterium]
MSAPIHPADFRLVRNASGNYALRVLTAKGRDYIGSTRRWKLVAPSPLDADDLFLTPNFPLDREAALKLIVDAYFDGLWIEYQRGDVS